MKKETCPRCFEEMREKGLNALSRRDNETEICSDCGTAEALTDHIHSHFIFGTIKKQESEDK